MMNTRQSARSGSPTPQEIQRRQTNTEKVLALFKAHHAVWLDSSEFEAIGGRMAWRSRIADARKIVAREGGVIENRFHRAVVTDPDGRKHVTGPIISEYRYLSYMPAGRESTPNPDAWPAFDAPIQEPFRLT